MMAVSVTRQGNTMPLVNTFVDQLDDAFNYARSALGICLPDNEPDKKMGETSQPSLHVVEGAVIVNGVALPQVVVDQLRQLGIALSWYSEGELEDAVEACAFDCQLIDDDDGVDFEDKLHYSEHKREEDDGEIEKEPVRKTM